MSIVQLDKVTFIGPASQKAQVLDELQQLGCLHLVDLGAGVTSTQDVAVAKEAREALRALDSCPHLRRPLPLDESVDLSELIQQILELQRRRDQLIAEQDELERSIELVEPWGEFEAPSVAELGGAEFFYYTLPLLQEKDLPDDQVWQVVARDRQHAYIVVIADSPPENMPGQSVELDPRSLSKLRERLETVEQEIDEVTWQRIALTRWRSILRHQLNAADDEVARKAASTQSRDDGELFVLQAWTPRVATEDLRDYTRRKGLALRVEAVSAEQQPPTLLKNPKRIAGAEGLVTFYITPGYHAWDPTTVLFFSLSLFFAMIVSDAGYGLAMLGIVLLLWKQLGSTPAKVSFRYLLLGIISAVIVYGIMVGSYFGVAPPEGSFLDSLRVRIDGVPMMDNQNAMMALSVAIGVIHLTLANCISAWSSRKTSRWIGHLGWANTMVGAFLVGAASLWEVSGLQALGQVLLVVGAISILFFSSDQPIATWDLKAHLKRLLDGIMQVTNVPKAFGDTLSYLRLFALGLASAQLAITFNGLASESFQAGGLGILLGLLILTLGHGINFLLALMGGVVHGLRLNCIEFFNWSLKEEGYPFRPFKKKADTRWTL